MAAPSRPLIDAHVPDYLTLIRLAIDLDAILRAYRPTVVAGAFEKSAHGGVLPALQDVHEFRLVNFQHGIIPLRKVVADNAPAGRLSGRGRAE